MSRRATSLNDLTSTSLNREIGSKYDVVKAVSEQLDNIEAVAAEDIPALIASLNEAKDFTGITVVTGETSSWDSGTKVLTVTVEQGEAGLDGSDGADGKSAYELAVDNGFVGTLGEWLASLKGVTGDTGTDGVDGVDGLTPVLEFNYNETTGDLEVEIGYSTEIDPLSTDKEW